MIIYMQEAVTEVIPARVEAIIATIGMLISMERKIFYALTLY